MGLAVDNQGYGSGGLDWVRLLWSTNISANILTKVDGKLMKYGLDWL